ncbi:hypothetical protein [Marinobacter salsuginis]|jgi:hypothetical protein|uniref:Uncharacterized protein n=1 Tax=Marinobacter salsuginis TaxID=418719 RepID=A0A5M3Q163_9GAMM|nr:hypothetical protein [Marinobacter salsuginis]GBO88729.1 hypothetical protein MSSD14B_23970 [Marinobacter salsuginis]
MKLKRRDQSLRLSQTIAGTRFPMNLGTRCKTLRWHNPMLYRKRDPRTFKTYIPFSIRGSFEYIFASSILDSDPGDVPKRIYRGCLFARRVRIKPNPINNLNRIRNISAPTV